MRPDYTRKDREFIYEVYIDEDIGFDDFDISLHEDLYGLSFYSVRKREICACCGGPGKIIDSIGAIVAIDALEALKDYQLNMEDK
jgi:hypothetical protein